MIYLFLTYIIFQVVYDNWIPDNQTGSIIYFTFQYGWIGALSFMEALRNRYYIFFLSFSLIMITFALCEINNVPQTSPGVTWFNVVIIGFLVLSLLKWTGSKITFGRRSL